MASLTDSLTNSLLAHISEGSHSAFEELYDLYFEKCFSTALYYLHSQTNAEDVVSEVFLSLWKNRHKLDKVINWESFLFISVRNHSLKFIEKNGRPGHDPLDMMIWNFHDSDMTPEEIALDSEFHEIMKGAISDLPDKSRMVYYMVREEKMSYKETGERLGISERTVNTHMTVAVKKLVSTITEYFK